MTANEIRKHYEADNNKSWYGIRTCNDDANVGDILPVSVNWVASECDEDGDYDKEEYKLDGSCAVDLGDDLDELTDEEIMERYDAAYNYPGGHVYLVKGTMIEYGNDENEVALSANGGGLGAEVVAILY